MIRFILVAIFLVIFFLISIPLYLIEIIIGKFNMNAKTKSSQWIVVQAFRIVIFLSGVRLTVKGLENVPKDIPVLYVGNHRSYFDIAIGYTLVKNNTGFISKKEMMKFPFVNVWMKFLNCQFLDRDNIKEGLKTILKCIDLVKNGTSIFIFPEGTRTSGDEMLPFKEGSLKIAEKSGCPIIPVAINNTESLFEDHLPKIKSSRVVFEFGQPIYIKDLDKETKKHAGAYVQSIIKDMIEKNSSLIK